MIVRIALVVMAAVAVARADADLDREIERFLAAEPAPKATSPWKITANFGLTFTDGNSDTLTVTAGFTAAREWEDWKLKLKERSVYSEDSGEQSANRHVFTERLDRKLSERASIFQELLAEHDSEADLKYRILGTLGYARRLVEHMGTFDGEEKTRYSLDAELGAGVQHDEYQTRSETSFIGQAGITVFWQINANLVFEHNTIVYPNLSNSGEFLLVSETKLSTPIGEGLDLNILFIDTYNSDPQAGKKNNDLLFAITITWKLS